MASSHEPADDVEVALPADWEELSTPEGEVYFYNKDTGETSWDVPVSLEETPPARAEQPRSWEDILVECAGFLSSQDVFWLGLTSRAVARFVLRKLAQLAELTAQRLTKSVAATLEGLQIAAEAVAEAGPVQADVQLDPKVRALRAGLAVVFAKYEFGVPGKYDFDAPDRTFQLYMYRMILLPIYLAHNLTRTLFSALECFPGDFYRTCYQF